MKLAKIKNINKSFVSAAKSMGAHKQPPIPKNAESTTKKENCLVLLVDKQNKTEATANTKSLAISLIHAFMCRF